MRFSITRRILVTTRARPSHLVLQDATRCLCCNALFSFGIAVFRWEQIVSDERYPPNALAKLSQGTTSWLLPLTLSLPPISRCVILETLGLRGSSQVNLNARSNMKAEPTAAATALLTEHLKWTPLVSCQIYTLYRLLMHA